MATLTKHEYRVETDIMDRDWMAKEKAALAELSAKVKAKRPGDKLAGQYWRSHVADGYAVYIIESSKPLVLAHVDVGDAWWVPYSMIRGLRLADVQHQIEGEKRLAEIFRKG